MKRLLVVLLSLGLIAGFCATASAADVKFSGNYYLLGIYENNPTLQDSTGYSKAYFYQRFRLLPVFSVAEGITVTAQFDALEKQWGNVNSKGGVATIADDGTSSRTYSATAASNSRIQENIEFERSFITFNTAVGQFQIGYQVNNGWGTQFGDSVGTGDRILWQKAFGPVTLLGVYEKMYDTVNAQLVVNQNKTDADNDTYAIGAVYNAKGIEGGLLWKYYDYRGGVGANPGVVGLNAGYGGRNGYLGLAAGQTQYHAVEPYVKATFGPVYVEAEVNYVFGKLLKSEVAGTPDVDLDAWGAYINAKLTLGPAYVGALVTYASGDDGSDATKVKTDILGAGTSYYPALILLNWDHNFYSAYSGTFNGIGGGPSSPTGITNQKMNSVIYSIYGGFNPTAKLSLQANVTYAQADKVPFANTLQKKDLGTEADIYATYKIFDSLSYMVAAGYLWTGDFFKGNSTTAKVDNDYMIKNMLTLSF